MAHVEGVVPKRKDGGYGHDASTINMAQAFPAFRFFGFDYHAFSIVPAQLRKVFTEAVFTCFLRTTVTPGAAFMHKLRTKAKPDNV